MPPFGLSTVLFARFDPTMRAAASVERDNVGGVTFSGFRRSSWLLGEKAALDAVEPSLNAVDAPIQADNGLRGCSHVLYNILYVREQAVYFPVDPVQHGQDEIVGIGHGGSPRLIGYHD